VTSRRADGCSFERLTAAGNVSQAFLTLLWRWVWRGTRRSMADAARAGTIEASSPGTHARGWGVSRYYVDKFLYGSTAIQVPGRVHAHSAAFVPRWEPRGPPVRTSNGPLACTSPTRSASVVERDIAALYAWRHPFLLLTS